MTLFLIALGLVVLVVLGNALLLLRTAKKPKLPESVQAKPYADDEDSW